MLFLHISLTYQPSILTKFWLVKMLMRLRVSVVLWDLGVRHLPKRGEGYGGYQIEPRYFTSANRIKKGDYAQVTTTPTNKLR